MEQCLCAACAPFYHDGPLLAQKMKESSPQILLKGDQNLFRDPNCKGGHSSPSSRPPYLVLLILIIILIIVIIIPFHHHSLPIKAGET